MVSNEGAVVTLDGRSLYARAAATGNAWSPTVASFFRGTSSVNVNVDEAAGRNRLQPLNDVQSTNITVPNRAGTEK